MARRTIESDSTTFTVTYHHSLKVFTVDMPGAVEVTMDEVPEAIRTGDLSPQVAMFYYRTNPCYIYYTVNGVQKKKEVPC